MKLFFSTIATAFSMFSRIPMPQFPWDERNMRYMMCAFPLVGLVIGGAYFGWLALCRLLDFSPLLWAVGLTLLPPLLNGGVHLDGFCDTTDALASQAEPKKRREILKDPHAGAFAVIGAGMYFLAYVGFCSELALSWRNMLLLGLAEIFARCLSALAVLCFPASANKGLLALFQKSAPRQEGAALLSVAAVLVGSLLIWQGLGAGLAMVIAALLTWWALYRLSMRKFGGISGDLAGWFLQMAMLAMLAALMITERVVA